jgi:flagellar biosynthesis protein FlhB
MQDQEPIDNSIDKTFKLLEDQGRFEKSTEIIPNTPRDGRMQYKLVTSRNLATALWLTLGCTIIWHLVLIAWQCKSLQDSVHNVNGEILEKRLDKSTALITDTAKTIYTFLLPLVVATTSYYFKEVDRDDNDD